MYVCADIWSFFYPGIKWRMLVVLPSQLFIMFINLASLVFGFEHVVFMIEGLFGEWLELITFRVMVYVYCIRIEMVGYLE